MYICMLQIRQLPYQACKATTIHSIALHSIPKAFSLTDIVNRRTRGAGGPQEDTDKKTQTSETGAPEGHSNQRGTWATKEGAWSRKRGHV